MKRAPRVGEDALSDPPWCGEREGRQENSPALWQFRGRNEKEARTPAPPPARAAACAASALDTKKPLKSFVVANQCNPRDR